MHAPTSVETLGVDGVIAAIAADDTISLDRPHVVHVKDPYLDITSIYGPFVDPIGAAAFAERLIADLHYEGCEQHVTTSIYPLQRT